MALTFIFALSLLACSRNPTPSPSSSSRRIVSLSPAITQMLIDLDLASSIVGVGEMDPLKPDSASIVGDLYRVDYEKLLTLQPTDIFIQPPQAGVPAHLTELAAQHHWNLHPCSLHTIADVLNTLYNPADPSDPSTVAAALDLIDRAADLRNRIQTQLDRIRSITSSLDQPDTLILFALNPPSAIGPATFFDEMLSIAGARNALADFSSPYPTLDREMILSLQPHVIILLGRADSGSLPAELQNLNVPAVSDHRVYYLDDPRALLPSTSIPIITADLARALHPDARAAIDRALETPQ